MESSWLRERADAIEAAGEEHFLVMADTLRQAADAVDHGKAASDLSETTGEPVEGDVPAASADAAPQ